MRLRPGGRYPGYTASTAPARSVVNYAIARGRRRREGGATLASTSPQRPARASPGPRAADGPFCRLWTRQRRRQRAARACGEGRPILPNASTGKMGRPRREGRQRSAWRLTLAPKRFQADSLPVDASSKLSRQDRGRENRRGGRRPIGLPPGVPMVHRVHVSRTSPPLPKPANLPDGNVPVCARGAAASGRKAATATARPSARSRPAAAPPRQRTPGRGPAGEAWARRPASFRDLRAAQSSCARRRGFSNPSARTWASSARQ